MTPTPTAPVGREVHEHQPTGFIGRARLFSKCAECGKTITCITAGGRVGRVWRLA